jgi:hypothetical protein
VAGSGTQGTPKMPKPVKPKAKDPTAPIAENRELRIIVTPIEAVPFSYVNYVEVANTSNDFSLLCVRLPAKLSEERRQAAMASMELHVEPDVVITFPVGMVPSLIRALTTQKESYERTFGQIREPSTSNE